MVRAGNRVICLNICTLGDEGSCSFANCISDVSRKQEKHLMLRKKQHVSSSVIAINVRIRMRPISLRISVQKKNKTVLLTPNVRKCRIRFDGAICRENRCLSNHRISGCTTERYSSMTLGIMLTRGQHHALPPCTMPLDQGLPCDSIHKWFGYNRNKRQVPDKLSDSILGHNL